MHDESTQTDTNLPLLYPRFNCLGADTPPTAYFGAPYSDPTLPSSIQQNSLRRLCANSSGSLAMDAGGRADGSGEALGAPGGSNIGRGEFISSLAASVGLGLGLVATVSSPGAAGATVQFETERYGDKELKIATVNKLRQQIRNSVRRVSG